MFWKKRIYLDAAAGMLGNPSSPHAEGRAAKAALDDARTRIARELQMKPDDLIFTLGATEANNIAIFGLARQGSHMLYLPSAHASVIEAMRAAEKRGAAIEPLVIVNGEIDIRKLKTQIRPETVLVSLDFVCGETGTIWNTREVRRALPAHVYVHVDASQAPLEESIERTRLGADLVTLDASKVGNIRGAGVLAAPRIIPLQPILFGGGQERGLRPGTENVEAIAAFAAALTRAREERQVFAARAQRARAVLISEMQKIPNAFITQGRKGIAHILNISLPGRDTDYLVALLDEAGFAISTKSACETDSTAGSRAVFALTGDAARAAATLRISWGPDTSDRDLAHFAAAIARAVAFLDQKS